MVLAQGTRRFAAIPVANEFLSGCNRRPDLAPDNSLPLTGVSHRLAYIGDWHCGVAMMDRAVALQPAPSELVLLPVFLRCVPSRRLAGGTAYQYAFFIEPRGAGVALRVARHARQGGACVVRRVARALPSLLDQNHARFAGTMEHGPAVAERLGKGLTKPSLHASMAWD